MKTIMLLLFTVGMTVSATAQETKYAKNYKVCRSETGYEICPDQSVSNLNEPPPKVLWKDLPAWRKNSFISPVSVGKEPSNGEIPTKEALKHSFPVQDWQKEENNRRNLNSATNNYMAPTTGEIR